MLRFIRRNEEQEGLHRGHRVRIQHKFGRWRCSLHCSARSRTATVRRSSRRGGHEVATVLTTQPAAVALSARAARNARPVACGPAALIARPCRAAAGGVPRIGRAAGGRLGCAPPQRSSACSPRRPERRRSARPRPLCLSRRPATRRSGRGRPSPVGAVGRRGRIFSCHKRRHNN